MRIDVISIFPGYLAPLHESLIGKAVSEGIIDLAIHDLRDWTEDNHHSVDDAPYGGGPGMVMRADIWGKALGHVINSRKIIDDDPPPEQPVLIIPTPSGEPFAQDIAADLADEAHLIVACGRYEGIDARVAVHAAETMKVRELSIGDYVLAGGEAAALVMIEAIGRLLPGVLGNHESASDDSFAPGIAGLLEGPIYTRPAEYQNLPIPEVLRSGDHAAIARYRRTESLRRTAQYRPELLAKLDADSCDGADLDLLESLDLAPPEGLAERIAAERAAKAAKKRRRSRAKDS